MIIKMIKATLALLCSSIPCESQWDLISGALFTLCVIRLCCALQVCLMIHVCKVTKSSKEKYMSAMLS